MDKATFTEQDKQRVRERFEQIRSAFLPEFEKYMKPHIVKKLKYEQDLDEFIDMDNDDTFAWCNGHQIGLGGLMPLLWEKYVTSNENFGKNLNAKLFEGEDITACQATYMDYMRYVISAGKDYMHYILGIMPHEFIHLCGISGDLSRYGLGLGEGITEYMARWACQKHNIHNIPVARSKNCEVANKLVQLLGFDTVAQYGFGIINDDKLNIALNDAGGSDFAKQFREALSMAIAPVTEQPLSPESYDPILAEFSAHDRLDTNKIKTLLNAAISAAATKIKPDIISEVKTAPLQTAPKLTNTN